MSVSSLWGLSRSLIVYYGQPWKTARMKRFYGQFIGDGDLCFDVGAHVGNRTRAWTSLGAKVVAVDPQPQMVRTLQRFFGANPNVHIAPVGVSDEPGSLELFINTRNPTLTTLSREWAEQFSSHPDIDAAPFDDSVTVPVKTLDALIAEHGVPVFCKIDVEGLEDKVLAGLSEPIQAVSFEAFPLEAARSVACVERLMALGEYQFRTVMAESFAWVEDGWISAEAMIERIASWRLDEGSGDVYAQRTSTG